MKRFSTTTLLLASLLVGVLWGLPLKGQVLFDNGPYYNSTGTGSGGANESVLYTTTFGMTTIGFGHQSASFNRVADDFAIPNCRWRIDSIVFFGYQTGSTTTSTFTGVNFRIWNGVPDQVGSTVVFGDTTTNRLSATRWSGAYRITETTTGNTTRPIMRNVCAVNGLQLTTGNYWIDWASLGSLASGPWAPARTPVGVAVTGNGRQRIGSVWNNLVDGGTGTPAQGLPFIIYGTILDPVADAGPDQSVCPGNSAMIGGSPSGTGGLGPLSYSWSPGGSLVDSTVTNPVATPTGTTNYVLSVTDSTGCTVVDSVTVTYGATSSNFLVADTTICSGTNLTLDAGTGTSYLWSTGDTTQTIVVGPGTYSVDVDNGSGCLSTDTVVVSASVPVTIVGNGTVCAALGDTLSTQIPYLNYIWSIGSTTPSIVVTQSGLYSVTVVDANGCTSSDTFAVTAIPSPVANFNFTVTGAGLGYDFSDQSTGATSWSWNFGDSNTSTSQNPSHTYAASGSYTVTLIATNACGSDTTTQTLTVVSVGGTLAGASIEVGPVPAQTSLRYQVSGLDRNDLVVQLTDLQGRAVAQWTHEVAGDAVDASADVSAYARGMYLLRFESGDQVVLRKVVLE